jgi:hypothetical protein
MTADPTARSLFPRKPRREIDDFIAAVREWRDASVA